MNHALVPPDYRTLFEAAPDLYLVLDSNLAIVAASDAYLRTMQRERDDVLGLNVYAAFPDNAHDLEAGGNSAMAASMGRLFASKQADVMPLQKYDVPRDDGQGFDEKHWRIVNAPILGDDGAIRYVLHRAEDVTEKVIAKREGEETERRLRTLLATLPCMIYRSSAEEPFPLETISAACQQITGYPPDAFLSDEVMWASLIHPDDLLLRAQSEPVALDGSFTSSEYRILHRDGSVRWVEDHHRTLQLPEGALVVEGVVYEITARKAADQEVQSARLAAEAATSAKSSFLASMSHEIRTPMNAIIGMTSILLDSTLTVDQQDAAEVIRGSGEHLLTLINDILDYSKIEAGKIDLERAAFSVRDCVESAIDIAASTAAQKGIELGYLMRAGTPERAIGDVGRLRQVLVNLISNAVKFTPSSGQVFIDVHADGESPGEFRVLHVAVKDTGIGIGPETRARLFQPFEQGDVSTTRLHGGTGLGLSISRRLVEMMGGHIAVDSAPGQGSTFRFSVRVGRIAGSGEFHLPYFAVPALRGRRVLIVDDIEVNRRILRHYVELWGMLPIETASSAEALAWVARGDAFDLALLDYQMPELDGSALAREIRAVRTEVELPILILSSAATELPALAGVADALLKPVKPSRLLEAVAKLLAHVAPTARAEPLAFHLPKTLGRDHPLRILVAEDNAMNQKLAKMLFAKMGYAPDFVSDGKEAVEAVARQTYDVVFMDVLMPVMDGLDATRVIVSAGPARPRIVGMSANAMTEDRKIAEAAGMDDYVPKPVPVEALVAALGRCIRRSA